MMNSSTTPLLTSTAAAPPTLETFKSLLDKPTSLRHLRATHALLLRHSLLLHPSLNFKLQSSYASLRRLDSSLALLRLTPNPSVVFFTSLINSHTKLGLHEAALSLYIEMLTDRVDPNAFTFSALLKSCPIASLKALHCHAVKFRLDSDAYVRTGLVEVYARNGDVAGARMLFDTMPVRSVVTLTAMMRCYTRRGEVDEARGMFDGMEDEERDVVCWNVMIDAYAQNGRPNEAVGLFRRMTKEKVRPDGVTVLALLSACGQIGALESGRWVHSYVESNGIQIDVQVGSALIDMYCKCGSLEDARMVFDGIGGKDVVVWNSMIVGYAMHGFSHKVLELFGEMCRIGYRPSDITFIGVLNACAYAGLVREGEAFFRSMKDVYGIEPKIEHYGCMVNLLSRAGKVEQAYEFVKNMKIEPDTVLWGTLLGACRLHGIITLGEKIAEFLVGEKIANSGTYVLLSNMYAAAGNWDGVAKVRTMMKNSGIQKEPGCSSIEVNKEVHEFLAGEKKCARSKEVYAMIEEINGWLKAVGYTPQTETVLHDLGEREKAQSLEVHSEKLAIAFGLISTRPGTTLKIVKNLRVCSDCHAVIKLISKITGRKIVMRDRNRFHHFESGSCSCGDYW